MGLADFQPYEALDIMEPRVPVLYTERKCLIRKKSHLIGFAAHKQR